MAKIDLSSKLSDSCKQWMPETARDSLGSFNLLRWLEGLSIAPGSSIGQSAQTILSHERTVSTVATKVTEGGGAIDAS